MYTHNSIALTKQKKGFNDYHSAALLLHVFAFWAQFVHIQNLFPYEISSLMFFVEATVKNTNQCKKQVNDWTEPDEVFRENKTDV